MKGEIRDERLRRILRETDPARVDAELTAEEIRAMRRTVLAAVPEPRRRFLSSPVLAVAAMAIMVGIVVLILRPGMNSRASDGVPSGTTPGTLASSATSAAPSPGRNSGTPRKSPGTSRQAAVPEGTAESSPAASAPGGRKPREKQVERIASAQLAGLAPNNAAEPRTRQVQFATPGGTRVIWILTSDKAL